MSYVVLSLKYRPQVFEDVAGQEHVTHTLINAFKKDRVAQGYMFTGPRGIGKTSTARILAKALNCKVSPGNPCNKCSNCQEIIDGRNMDVLEIDGASNRGIEEIRNLREQIKYAPMNSPFKIFIIDEVHMLTTQAFNALLRTLEEPPAHGKFILATTDIHKVPPTILSRCQRFDFNRMTVDIIGNRIREIMKKESITCDEQSVAAIARKADGSMRDALSLLDQLIAYAGESFAFDDVTKVLGLIPMDMFFELFDGFSQKDAGMVVDFLSKVRKSGLPVSEIARGINEHIRNLLFAKVPEAIDSLEVSSDLAEKYSESVTLWNTKDLVRISRIISDLEKEARKASQPHIFLEISLLKILEMDSAVKISSLLKGEIKPQEFVIKAPERKKKSKDTQDFTRAAPEEKTAPTITEPAVKQRNNEKDNNVEPKLEHVTKQEKNNPDETINNKNGEPFKRDLDTAWLKVFGKLLKERPSIASILEESTLSEQSNNRFVVTLHGQSDFSLHMAEKGKTYIDGLLSKELGTPVSTSFKLAKKDSTPVKKKNSTKPSNGGGEDTVARIIELFDGEIVS